MFHSWWWWWWWGGDLNKATKREHFQLPTNWNIATRLSGATVFSKLDAISGYKQIPLDEASQLTHHMDDTVSVACRLV